MQLYINGAYGGIENRQKADGKEFGVIAICELDGIGTLQANVNDEQLLASISKTRRFTELDFILEYVEVKGFKFFSLVAFAPVGSIIKNDVVQSILNPKPTVTDQQKQEHQKQEKAV